MISSRTYQSTGSPIVSPHTLCNGVQTHTTHTTHALGGAQPTSFVTATVGARLSSTVHFTNVHVKVCLPNAETLCHRGTWGQRTWKAPPARAAATTVV